MASNTQLVYNRRRAKRRAAAESGFAEQRPRSGNNVSHAHNKTKRLFRPNLQKAKVLVDGKLVSVRIDAKTIRSLSKQQKERKPIAPKRKPSGRQRLRRGPATGGGKPAAKK